MNIEKQTALQKAIEEIKSMAGQFEHQRIPAAYLLSKIIPLLEDEKKQLNIARLEGINLANKGYEKFI
jgi:inhibitor of KinA sporulation pathway (predicted exonuclease)